MRYTFKISFNGSTWTDFTPSNAIEWTTKADEGTFRYRTEVNEIKINKSLNSAIYDQLESWYFDSTKFSTEITIRAYKDEVKWEGVFGIKQGRLNMENGYYTIKPEVNDMYRYIYWVCKRQTLRPSSDASLFYLDEDGDYSKTNLPDAIAFYETYVKQVAAKINLDTGLTFGVKSSKFWNDTYPDGSPPPVGYYDSLLDTLIYQATSSYVQCEQIMEACEYFNSGWYVDENDDIRIEHLEYFEDLIADYEIDLRDENEITPEFEQIDGETYAREVLSEGEKLDLDWDRAIIRYLPFRTSFKDTELEINNPVSTFVDDDTVSTNNCLFVSSALLVAGFTVDTFVVWDYYWGITGLLIDGSASGPGAYANSNLFSSGGNFDYYVNISYLSGAGKLRIKGSASGTDVLNAGVNTGTLNGTHVVFDTTDACAFAMELRITISDDYRLVWRVGAVSSAIKANGDLAPANVLSNYYLHGRQSRSGDLLETPTNFNSTVYNKRLKEFKMFYEDDIDPMHGVLTDWGIARIESYKRDLNDMVTFTLTFQEDE